MTHLRPVLVLAITALISGGTSVAGEIYKWTDDQGNVHYEDRPIAKPPVQVERLDVVSRNTDPATVQARLEADREARAAARQVASEAPPEMSKEEVRAEQEKRQEQCQMYRDRLEQYLRSTRLYKEDDSGERQYLDESESLAARERVEDQIKKYCGE
jgi:Domain of unknown function (DUF4124)